MKTVSSIAIFFKNVSYSKFSQISTKIFLKLILLQGQIYSKYLDLYSHYTNIIIKNKFKNSHFKVNIRSEGMLIILKNFYLFSTQSVSIEKWTM